MPHDTTLPASAAPTTEAGRDTEVQYVTRESLGRALHATSPHAKLHPWETCPQQDYDLRDADDILTYIRLREATATQTSDGAGEEE